MNKFLFTLIVLLITVTITVFGQKKVQASYYADKFHGKLTASGSPYHRDSLTCAHKTLPFGTILKVVNPENDKTVYVKVTDRGPFTKGRSIDLSYAAAKEIGIISHGIATVVFSKVDKKEDTERIEVPNIETLEKIELSPEDILIPQDNTAFINESIELMPFINNDNNIDTNSLRANLFPSRKVILQALNLLPEYLPRQKPLIVG